MGWWEDLTRPPVQVPTGIQPANVPDASGNYSYAGSIPQSMYDIQGGYHIPKGFKGGYAGWRNLDAIERMQERKNAEGIKLGFHNDQPMTPQQQQAFGRVVADQYKPMNMNLPGIDDNTLAYAQPTKYGGSLSLPANYPNADLTHEGGHVLDGIFARKGKDWWRKGGDWRDTQRNKLTNAAPGVHASSGRSAYDMTYDRPFNSSLDQKGLQLEGDNYLQSYDDSSKAHEELANTVWWRTHNPQELQDKNPKLNDYLNQQIKAQPGLWEVLSKGQNPSIWGEGPTMA